MDERLKKQMDFILEVDKIKSIFRQTYIASGVRKENDAEHSWHLALMACLLSEHSTEKVDLAKTMVMVLIHDIVEIDAGDTYAYDPAGNATKRAVKWQRQTGFLDCFPEDQGICSWNFGKNLRRWRHPRQSSRRLLTVSSR